MSAIASCHGWTEAEIAALSPRDIARLDYDEMLELAGAEPARADGPRVTESNVLVRLVYALRQRCRDKIAASASRAGV